MKTVPSIALAGLVATSATSAQTTQNYPDSTGEIAMGSFPHIDITSVDVTVNAAETEITFKINLDGDPVVTNWGNYMVGIKSGNLGDTTGNGWNRPISFAGGMTHWVGCWVNDGGSPTGGNGQVWDYVSSAWGQSSTPLSVTPVGAPDNSVEIVVDITDLALAPGETFSFDVYTTGGGNNDSAVDALSAAAASIPNWPGPFTTDAVGGTPNPALEFTMPGAIDFATWITGFGLAVADQDPGDDPDGDNLTNQQEFDAKLDLNPNEIDTDFDGLNDDVEDGGGIYVSPTQTGTLPAVDDTDGDFALDGEEVDGTYFEFNSTGFISDPNTFNHFDIVIAGDFVTPPFDPTGTNTDTLMNRVGTSFTEQYQWTQDFNVTTNGTKAFKFTNGLDWASPDHWQWGATGTPGVAARNAGNITFDVPVTGLHTFTLDTNTLAYSVTKMTFADEAAFLAAYGLSAGGDEDMDNILNEDEFALGTDPTNPDSDGDGLNDDVETDDDTWDSTSDTGTDPLDPDTDGDGIPDGVESNSGNFVDETDTGTHPLLTDSDGDHEGDALELFQGTDPTDINDSSAANGLPLVDGVRDEVLYGDPVAVQTVQTGFGDNGSELDAAYASIVGGKLYLMVTGNLEANFNKMSILIDSAAGGSNEFLAVTDNDGSNAMDGMFLDTGFEPDYHLIARRGDSKFDLNFADLIGNSYDFYENVFGGSDAGKGTTGTGTNASAILAAYDGSNTAGIGGSQGDATDKAAAKAVTTGLELCIDLADLGSPAGPFKIMVFINNSSHGFLSNQILGGLPVGSGNLGDPTPDGQPVLDFTTITGDQFFTVGDIGELRITNVRHLPASNEVELTLAGLVEGSEYIVGQSDTLVPPFNEVLGANFTATGSNRVITVPTGGDPAKYYQVAELVLVAF